LYPALEALGPATERAERQRLSLADDQAHAVHRGVDVSRPNWREVLLGWVRRDVICQGDDATYRTAYKASNGLEHGSEDMPYIRTASTAVASKLFGYVRKGILDLLNLDPPVRGRLAAMSPVDITPFQHSITGMLTGNVADPTTLGPDGEPYPWLDWEIPIDEVTVLPDGRVEAKPRYKITPRIGPDVQFTGSEWKVHIGLNDPGEFAPPNTEGESF
jgi:hypothetical protein